MTGPRGSGRSNVSAATPVWSSWRQAPANCAPATHGEITAVQEHRCRGPLDQGVDLDMPREALLGRIDGEIEPVVLRLDRIGKLASGIGGNFGSLREDLGSRNDGEQRRQEGSEHPGVFS
jgi:hypothetical protein